MINAILRLTYLIIAAFCRPNKKMGKLTKKTIKDPSVHARLLEMRAERHLEAVRKAEKRQSFKLAIIAGIVMGLVSSSAWFWIAVTSGWLSSLYAIGVGATIGYSMWIAGRGRSRKYGTAAATITFFSILLGNMFIVFHELSLIYGSYSEALKGIDIRTYGYGILGFVHYLDVIFALVAMGIAHRYSYKTVEAELGKRY